MLQQADIEGPTAPGQPSYGPTGAHSTPIRQVPGEDAGKNLQKGIKSILERNNHVQLS